MSRAHEMQSGQVTVPKPDGPNITNLLVGPTKIHPVSPDEMSEFFNAHTMSHRGDFAKTLIKGVNIGVFDMMGVPLELRNHEFTNLSETPEGWHVLHTGGGTAGMYAAIAGACLPEGTLLVDNGFFANLAGQKMEETGRSIQEIVTFERGQGLIIGSPEFDGIAEKIKNGSIKCIYLVENATTTGVNQSKAIQELVKIRDEANTNVIIIVDAVSGFIMGGEEERKRLPDIIFWGNQKQTAIGTGSGELLFNNRALARAMQIEDTLKLDAGRSFGIRAAYGTKEKRMAKRGQTQNTPPMAELYRQLLVLQNMYGENQGWKNVGKIQAKARQLIHEALDEGGELGEFGLRLLTSESDLQSSTVHVLKFPEGVDATKVLRKARDLEQVKIAPGFGPERETEARLAVYSAHEVADVKKGIASLAKGLKVI